MAAGVDKPWYSAVPLSVDQLVDRFVATCAVLTHAHFPSPHTYFDLVVQAGRAHKAAVGGCAHPTSYSSPSSAKEQRQNAVSGRASVPSHHFETACV